MENELYLILSIVGAFGTIALGINAFFLKGIYTELNLVKIKMAEIYTNAKHFTKEIELLSKELDLSRKKYHDLRNFVQRLELRLNKLEIKEDEC